MKHFKIFLLFSFFIFSSCARGPIHKPAPAIKDRKTDLVVILMLDGMRQENAYQSNKSFLQTMANEGIAFDGRDTYPSETVVNFMSMGTGSYPDKHGITGGKSYYDANFKPVAFDREHLGVPTLFEVLEKNGMRGLFMGMKGYDLFLGGKSKNAILIDGTQIAKKDESSVFGNRYSTELIDPKFKNGFSYGWAQDNQIAKTPADMAFANKLRIVQVTLRHTLQMIREAAQKGPLDVIALNLASTDLTGHSFGPHDPYYDRAAVETSQGAEFAVSEIKKIFPEKRVTVMISADHGFTQVSPAHKTLGYDFEKKKSSLIDMYFSGIPYEFQDCGTTCIQFYVKNPSDYKRAYERFKAEQQNPEGWVEHLYTYLDFSGASKLQDLRAYYPGHSAQFYVDIRPTWGLGGVYGHGSTHDEDMKIPMIFSGQAIRKTGFHLTQKVSIVDIAPTALYLLGVSSPKEWDGRIVREALTE